MTRKALILLAVALAASTFGCGGSDNNENNNFITITEFQFQPSQTTVPVGTTVQWLNAGNATHSVVSGTLNATRFPTTTQVDVFPDQFSMLNLNLDLGDQVIFTNQGPVQAQVRVQDQNNSVIFLSAVLNPTQQAIWRTTKVGRFSITNALSPGSIIATTVTGFPDANGLFDSGVITPGGKFQFTFNIPGTFTYFCGVHFEEQGTITVQ